MYMGMYQGILCVKVRILAIEITIILVIVEDIIVYFFS